MAPENPTIGSKSREYGLKGTLKVIDNILHLGYPLLKLIRTNNGKAMMRRHSLKVVLFLVLLLTTGQIFSSCNKSDSPVAPVNAYNPLQVPIVKGIWLTDESGQRLGAWGEPIGFTGYKPSSRGKLVPSFSSLLPPYPNPSDDVFTLSFAMAYASDIKISIVRAIGPGESWDAFTNSSGAIIPSLNFPVAEYETVGEAGGVRIEFSIRNDGGQVPVGFYRIYVQDSHFSDSVDVFLYNGLCGNLPPLMPGFEGECP